MHWQDSMLINWQPKLSDVKLHRSMQWFQQTALRPIQMCESYHANHHDNQHFSVHDHYFALLRQLRDTDRLMLIDCFVSIHAHFCYG